MYKGVWKSVESGFLRWKGALQALTMMSATRWQSIANKISLDCNCTKIETIITRHRNKIQHCKSSGGHFGWTEEYYRGEQKTKTFEWMFCPAIIGLKDDIFIVQWDGIPSAVLLLRRCLRSWPGISTRWWRACLMFRWKVNSLFSEKEIVWFTNNFGQRPLTNKC